METPAATRAKNAANVNHGQMLSEFKKLKEDIQSDFASQLHNNNVNNNASLTRDLTQSITTELRAIFNEQIKAVNDRVDVVVFDLHQHIDQHKKEVAELKTAINQLRMNIPYQLIWDNEQHMRNRHKSCRVHGFHTNNDTPHSVLTDVYEALVAPSFGAAVKDGLLKSVPPLYACIEYGHKLAPRQDSSGPPVILVKFISRLFSSLFVKYSKDIIKKLKPGPSCSPPPPPPPRDDGDETATPVNYAAAAAAPNSADNNPKHLLRVGRDLTPQLRSVMTAMYADNLISKVRLAGEKIQWQWTNGDAWLTCHNPFAQNYADMQIRVLPPGANPLMLD